MQGRQNPKPNHSSTPSHSRRKHRHNKSLAPTPINTEQKAPPSPIIYSNPEIQTALLRKYNLYPNPNAKDFVKVFNALHERKFILEVQSTSVSPKSDDNTSETEQKKILSELAMVKQEKEILFNIAHKAISHIKQTGGRPEELRELVDFACIQDRDFITFLLSCLLEKEFFSNPAFLQTFKLVILTLDKKFYENNIATLLKIAVILEEIISKTHTHAQSYHDIINTIEALHVTWLALSLGHLEMANETLWTRQVALFKTLSDNPFRPLAYRAKLMHQSLARIDHEKDPEWKENCIRGYKIISGIAIIANSVRSGDLGGIASGALTVWEGSKSNHLEKREWYSHIILLETELGDAATSTENFNVFKTNLSLVIKNSKRHIDLSYGVFELVQRITLNGSISSAVRCLAIQLLDQMYTDKRKWHADILFSNLQGKGNGDDQLRVEILRTLATLTSAQDTLVQTHAAGTLKALYSTFKTKAKGTGFKIIEAFMPGGVCPHSGIQNTGLMNIMMQPDILRTPQSNQLLGHVIGQLPSGSLSPESESSSDSSVESPNLSPKEKKEHPINQAYMLQTIPQPTLNTMQRDIYIELIEANFIKEAKNNRKPIVILHGMPGIGKTQIAINYVHKHEKDKNFIYWANGNELESQWIELGKALSIPEETLNALSKDQKLKIIRDTLAYHPNWIIILDNMANEEMLTGLLPDHLTQEQQVLITTRNPDWSGYCSIALKPFTTEEVKDYFQVMEVNPTEQEGAGELAKELEFNPLALYYAISYMRVYHISAKSCQKHYLEEGINLFSAITLNTANKAHYHDPVLVTYKSIIDHLRSTHQNDAINLLICCSYLNYQKIEDRFLLKFLNWTPEKLKQNILALRPYQIISILDPSTFQMCKLAQEAVRDYHKKQLTEDHLKSYLKHMSKTFSGLYPVDKKNKKAYMQARLIIPHIEAFIRVLEPLAQESDSEINSISADILQLYMFVFNYHRTVSGSYKHANLAARNIYFIRSTIGDLSSLASVFAHNAMGVTYNELDNTSQSLTCHQEALAICQRAYEKPDPSIAECHSYLGNMYYHANNIPQSLTAYETALKIYGRCKIVNDFDVMSCKVSLARTKAKSLKNAAAAIDLCKETLEFYKTKYDQEHPMIAEIHTQFSNAYSQLFLTSRNLEHKKLAREHNETALRIRLEIFGYATHWVAESYLQLTLIQIEANELSNAISSCNLALRIYLEEYQDQPYLCVAECHVQLALIYKKMDSPKEEREQLEKLLAIYMHFDKQDEISSIRTRIGSLPQKKLNYLAKMNSPVLMAAMADETKVSPIMIGSSLDRSPPVKNRPYLKQRTPSMESMASISASPMLRSPTATPARSTTSGLPASSVLTSPLSLPRRFPSASPSVTPVSVFSTTRTAETKTTTTTTSTPATSYHSTK